MRAIFVFLLCFSAAIVKPPTLLLAQAPAGQAKAQEIQQDDARRRTEEANAQQRIAQLEERVALLERMVDRLLEERAEKREIPLTTERPVETAKSVPPQPTQIPEATAEKYAIPRSAESPMPPELVPDIGKIGAEVGLLISGSSSPFQLNNGSFVAGFIDLPLIAPNWIRGKLSYEILVGQTQSNTKFDTTSNVAQVANLTVLTALNPNGGLQNVQAALTGTGAAPFPVVTNNQTRLRLLQVVPFAFKYTNYSFERWRFRPYGVLGFGTYVTIHHQNPARGNPPTYGLRTDADLDPALIAALSQVFGGQAPFGGPLVAGQISQSPELEARGLPGGHGNFDLGIHSGVGFEYRLHKHFSLGFDARFNKIAGSHGAFRTYGSRLGFHF